jgi:ribosomal protein L18E
VEIFSKIWKNTALRKAEKKKEEWKNVRWYTPTKMEVGKNKMQRHQSLLMDRLSEETKEELASGVRKPAKRLAPGRSKEKLREMAKTSLYTDEKDRIVIPARNLWAALIGAGREVVYKTSGKAKFKITTADGRSKLAKLLRFKSVKSIPITLNGRELKLDNENDWKVDDEWSWTRNPTTGNPMPVIRPRIDEWEFELTFAFNENEIQENSVKELWAEAGLSQGLGSPRAEKGFPCGQFEIIEWTPIPEPTK